MLCTHPCKCRVYFHVPSPLGMAPAVQDDSIFVATFYPFSKLVSKPYHKSHSDNCLFRLTSLSPGHSFWLDWFEAQMINLIWLHWLSKYLITQVVQNHKKPTRWLPLFMTQWNAAVGVPGVLEFTGLLLTSLARPCCTQRQILCFCTRDEEIHLLEGLKWITDSLYKGEFHASGKGKKLFLTVSHHLVTAGEKWAFKGQHPSADQVLWSSWDNFPWQWLPLWHFTCYHLP